MTLLDVLGSGTVAAALLAALAWLMRSWITERLKAAVKHEYDREIESYKSMLALVHGATAAGQKAAIEARMSAFDRIWKAMLALKNNTGSITLFLDILTVDEYKTLKNHRDFIAITGTLNEQKIQQMMPDRNIEEARPYVGELVWSYFFAYQAFTLRVVLLAWLSTSKDEDKINWHKDSATRRLLASALTDNELARLDSLTIGKIEFARRTIEMKVLTSWQRLISGATFGDEAMKQAQNILEAASNVRKSG
jgi:hypothetical protein